MTDLSSSVLTSRRKIIVYWVTTALVVFELTMGGAWDILRVPQVRGLIERLGILLTSCSSWARGNCSVLWHWSFRSFPD